MRQVLPVLPDFMLVTSIHFTMENFFDFFEVCITDSYKYLFYTRIVSIISIAQ